MLNFDLIKQILVIAIASSVITTAVVQKVKELIKSKKYLWLISLGVSMTIGSLFAYSFSQLSWQNTLWVGLCTFVGADTLYKVFEDKIFTSFKDMKNVTSLEREDRNE